MKGNKIVMDNNFLLYKNASTFTYAASIASTWIWAPALFISSSNAYFNGIEGFLWFWIPNVLTLILFGIIAEIIRKRKEGITVTDAINNSSNRQKRLHLLISTIILICSSTVQLLGLYTLFSQHLALSKLSICIIISLIALLTVFKGGIKYSIITDKFKWYTMAIIGFILLYNSFNYNSFSLTGYKTINSLDIALTFGIPTTIGLLCAPYVDQTFWQRVYSIEPNKIKKTFFISAILFGLIPLLFGLIGFFQERNLSNWNLGILFDNGILLYLLMICVVAALLSTLDSNLCAISSIAIKDFKLDPKYNIFSMIFILILSTLIANIFTITITELFLIYGTIRTCMAMPTFLIMFNRYDEQRLFYSTVLTAIIASVGYILAPTSYKFIFTIIALLLPLLGYRSLSEKVH